MSRTIDIDCAPGAIRPDAYYRVICEKLGIEYQEPICKFFGNWTWQVPDLTEEQEKLYAELVPTYIKGLYENGNIRYGSW